MCSDHNLLPEGRMSYSELFLMVLFYFIFNKIQSLQGKKKSGLADTWWLLFWIQGLMVVNNSFKSTHLTEAFSACFCHELYQKHHWILSYHRSCQASSNSSLQILQCTFFNCKINLFQVIDAACKWNTGKLQIVCETRLSAHGTQCSVTLQIVFPLWKGFFFVCLYSIQRHDTFGLVF